MAFREFDGELDKSQSGSFREFDGKLDEDDGFLSNVGGLLKSGAQSAITAARLSGDVATGDIDKGSAAQISEELNRARPAPQELEQAKGAFKEAGEDWRAADEKQGLQSFLGKAEGLAEMFYAVGKEAVTNPKGLAYLTAEQAANMAPSIAGMIVGAKGGAAAGGLIGTAVAPGPGTAAGVAAGGIVGGVGGAFAGEWPMEAGSELIGLVGAEVARRGIKADEQGVAQVLADQTFMQDAIGKVRTKATVTSGIDAAFTLGAGKLATAPAKAAMRDRIARGAGAVALDVAGGGASEAGGELAAYGKVDLENVGAEMLGELGGSAIEVPSAVYALRNKISTTDILDKSKTVSESIDTAASMLDESLDVRTGGLMSAEPVQAQPIPPQETTLTPVTTVEEVQNGPTITPAAGTVDTGSATGERDNFAGIDASAILGDDILGAGDGQSGIPAEPVASTGQNQPVPDGGDAAVAFADPHEERISRHFEKAEKAGVSREHAEVMAPEQDLDHVTGFYRGEEKGPTLKRAQEYVEKTGEAAHYVDADIANLGGINAHFENNADVANQFYRGMADIFREEMQKAGSRAVMIRQGGDEISAVVIGGNSKSIAKAMAAVHQRTQDYASENGLGDIPYGKRKDDKTPYGTGIYMGAAEIQPGQQLDDMFKKASVTLNKSKEKGLKNVTYSENEALGTGSLDQQTRRAEEGTGGTGTGTGPENGQGPAGIPAQETKPTAKPVKKRSSKANTLLTAVRDMGGLSLNSKRDVAGDKIAPGGYNQLFRTDAKNTLEGLSGKGELDEFLPYELRFATNDQPGGEVADMQDAVEWLKDKMRSGERVIPYDAQMELDQRAIEAQALIDAVEEELSYDEINAQLQLATDSEREDATNARIFNPGDEEGSVERSAGTEAGKGARTEAGTNEPAYQLQSQTNAEIAAKEARAQDTTAEDKAAADRAAEVPLTLSAQSQEKTDTPTAQAGMFTPDGRATVAAESKPKEESFKTAMGSTYIVHSDGTTTRTKAARDLPGHEGDSGLKTRSEKTIYIDPKIADALAIPDDSKWRMVEHTDGTFSLAIKNNDGNWGISPSAKGVPVKTKFETGLVPLELWGKETLKGLPAYSTAHFGNAIVQEDAKPAQKPTDEAAKAAFFAQPTSDENKAKKLDVIKAQAKGEVTGDQAAALKELADAGEHAAVDAVLKPAKPAEAEPKIEDLTAGELSQRGDASSLRIQEPSKRVPLSTEESRNIVRSPAFFEKLRDLLEVPISSKSARPSTNSVDSSPATGERSLNGVRSDTNALSNILDGATFFDEPFGSRNAETKRLVLAHVLGLGQNQKVRDAVVKFIPVDVMDNLISAELSPNSLFNNSSMLKQALSLGFGSSIPTRSDFADALVRAITLAGAEVSSGRVVSDLERPALNRAAADGTLYGNHGNDNTRNDGQSKPDETDKGTALFSRAQSYPELAAALEKYEGTGEIATVQDLSNEVDALIGEDLAPDSLQSAIEDYRQEIADDHAYAGRGDMEAADERFVDAVRAALAAKQSRSTQPVTNPHTIKSAQAAMLDAHTGADKKALQSLLDSGKARVINAQQAQAITQDVSMSDNQGRALAFFNQKDGITYFIADNITEGYTAAEWQGLVRHEIGVHAFQLGKDSAEFKDILKQVELMRKAGNKAVHAAFKRVPADTAPENVTEESIGYLVQDSPDLPIVKRIVAWFRNAIRAIGKSMPVMQRAKFFEWAAKLNENDILYMAQTAMAKSYQEEAGTEYMGAGVMASRKQSPESFARMVMEEFAAENDAAFSIPTTSSKTIPGAVADVMPGSEYKGEITQEDERAQSGADNVYLFKTKSGDEFTVYSTDDGRVWINVSQLLKGTGGQEIYSAIADYAFNSGKKFIGDPYGLTMDSIIRRTVNMLTSAIRHGTTKHLEPAQQQEWGKPEDGVEPLDWTGSDVDKTEALIHTFVKTMHNLAPSIQEYRYDFQSKQFVDLDGNIVSGKDIVSGIERDSEGRNPQRDSGKNGASAQYADGQGRSGAAEAVPATFSRAARAGEKTARRAVFLQSLISEARKSNGERNAVLERVLSWGNNSSPENLKQLFSRSTPSGQGRIPLQGGETGNPASWDSPEPSTLDNVIYKLQDKNIDLKRVIEEIKATGKELADSFNTYLQEELFHGRAAKRTQDFVNTEMRPLLDDMRMRGLTIEQLDEYLHARHAKEANALIAERDPDMPDGGSGMTNQEADDYMAGLSDSQKTRLDAVAKRVDAILAKTRDMYATYGLVSKDQTDAWGKMFKHYVPLMREDHDGGMGMGQGFSVKGKEVKHRTGSSAKVVDILANIALQREKAITRGEKNRVAVSLFGLVKLNPNADFWTAGPISERRYNETTGLVEYQINGNWKNKDNAIVAKISDGKGNVVERAVIFNERNERAMRMAKSLKNLDTAQMEGLWGASAQVTRYFASVNTQYNPVFGITNLIRDVQGMVLNLDNTALAKHKLDVLKAIPGMLKGIYQDARMERKGRPNDSETSQLWEELQDEGGMTGYRDLYRNSEDRANAIKHELDPHNWVNNKWGKVFTAGGMLKVPLTKAQDMAGPIFDLLTDYNQTLEGATRLATYKVALDNGFSKQQAASLAKNITVNFNRKGQVGQQAGALYAFFNAAMQGTARIGQTIFDIDNGNIKTLRLNKTGKAIVYGGVLLGVMQAVALAATGFDDDEPPEFVRERSLIIPFGLFQRLVGVSKEDASKRYLSIPMPLGFHVLPNIGRIATEFTLNGFKKPTEHVIKLAGIFVEAFNPIGSAGMSLQTIAPTGLDPFAALAENRDWTGKNIAQPRFDTVTPGFSHNKDTATTMSKLIAEALNTLSGGDKYTAGALSPTADQLDYLAGQVGGGVWREGAKLEQGVMATITGEELPAHKIPLFGRFYGNADSKAGQGGTYYSNLQRIKEVKAGLEGRLEDKLPVDKFKQDNPEFRLINRAKLAERTIQKLKKQKRELIDAGDRDKVKAVEERITQVMMKFNESVASFDASAQ